MMTSRFEIKRDEAEFAAYERDVEGGFTGTFADWLSARVGESETEPPPSVDEDIEF